MSNASPASATSPTRARSPVCTRCERTAPIASSIGIGARRSSDAAIAQDRGCVRRAAPRARSRRSAEQRRPEPLGPVGGLPDRVEGHRREAGDVVQCRHLLGQEDRVLDAEHAGVAGPLEQRRAPPPEVHPERHHHRLAERVDRRVGDLGEPLAEVAVAPGGLGERRDRRVVAHAPHRVDAGRPSARARGGDPRNRSRNRAEVWRTLSGVGAGGTRSASGSSRAMYRATQRA